MTEQVVFIFTVLIWRFEPDLGAVTQQTPQEHLSTERDPFRASESPDFHGEQVLQMAHQTLVNPIDFLHCQCALL